jgi:hypothetical protein
MSIQRFKIDEFNSLNATMAKSEKGGWVRYEDHIIEVSTIRRYFVEKLNQLNQIMVDALYPKKEKPPVVTAPEEQGIESESEVVNAGTY